MNLNLDGKTALVMSSTRGLGFGCAKILVAEGARVVINGRNKEHGLTAITELNGKAHFIQADISNPIDRDSLFKEVQDMYGSISILVTNSDGPKPGTFMSKSNQDWQAAFELVMLSAIDMIQKCIPDMIEHGYGRIVNISSISAKETSPGIPLTNGIKPGLLGALGTLAREVGNTGVTVNSILPGPFDTDLMRRYAHQAMDNMNLSQEQALELYAKNTPMKRLGSIEEFGALCAFLCSQQAGYITGQSIAIDGGKMLTLL